MLILSGGERRVRAIYSMQFITVRGLLVPALTALHVIYFEGEVPGKLQLCGASP